MSDCANGGRNVYEVPPFGKGEPGVLYQHALYSHEFYEGLSAIQVSGIRFYREGFEVLYVVEDGVTTGVIVEGRYFAADDREAPPESR